ncbi:MAG: thioredoxin family protein, partial [Moraxellaceae bacterium]|nr:thioredoxin family protein [Moraxellaceae bacterium]
VISGLAGLWWLRPSSSRPLAASLLLLLATASGYIGIRLLLTPAPPIAAPFTLQQVPGQFQVIPASNITSALAAAKGRPVLLEFYADWCPSCVVWKNEVFSRADVQQAMRPFILLQVDASDFNPAVQTSLDGFGLAGLPAILLFDADGQERTQDRLLGEMAADDFITWLAALSAPQ